MNKIIIIFLYFSSIIATFSQCDGAYFLYTQQQVDEFPKKVNRCKEINQLFIEADGISDITNLDSLYFIERVTTFLRLNNRLFMKSIDGLKNLRFAYTMQIKIYDSKWKLPSLDTVGTITVEFLAPGLNLSCFSNLSVIGSLSLSGDAHFSGLSRFKAFDKSKFFGIGVHNNTIPNKIAGLLPSDINELPASLALSDCKNIDTKGLENITIKQLYLENIYKGDVDFTALNHVKKLKTFVLNLYKSTPAYLDILPNLDTIEQLWLRNNSADISVFNFSKNVKKVSGWISIENNENYKDISWLDKLPLPDDALNFRNAPDGKKSKIIIKENKNLELCNVDMLCKALVRYPDSVYIEGNGKKCNKMEIIEFCKKTSTVNEQNNALSIFPNPTSTTLWIKGLDKTSNYIIRDIMGKEVSEGKAFDAVDIHHLASGIYILEVQNEGIATITKIKFVKY